MEGNQGRNSSRNLEAATQTQVMKEHCLLDYS